MRWVIAALVLCAAPAAHAQTVDPLHAAVMEYAGYQSDISTLLDTRIASQADLDAMLDLAGGRTPARVARGWLAYGALTAAQSPAFVRGVRSRVSAAGRPAVLRLLRRDLGYARRRPPGSAEAVRLILIATRADELRMAVTGRHYIGVARTIEAASWEVSPDDARERRNTRLRAQENARLPPAFAPHLHVTVLDADPIANARAFGGPAFWDWLAGRIELPYPTATPSERAARAQIVDRMLSLAALFIVGASGEETGRVETLIEDAPTRDCLALEQLQYRQCVSVSHFAHEGAYCMARHALSGPGACFALTE